MNNLVTIVMPIFQGKKEIVVGSKISQSESEAFQQICEIEDRSMSYILRELALRGMAQYSKDGLIKLTSDEEKIILSASAVFEGKTTMTAAGSVATPKKPAKSTRSDDEDMGLRFSGGKGKTNKENEAELNRQMDAAIEKTKKNKK